MTAIRFVLVLGLVAGVVTSVSSRFNVHPEDTALSAEKENSEGLALRADDELPVASYMLDVSSVAVETLDGSNPFKASDTGENPVDKKVDDENWDAWNLYVENLQESCDERCSTIQKLLEPSRVMSDSELEHSLGMTDELAETLIDNPERQRELIDLALHASGNTRSLIIFAFNQMEPAVQRQLGIALAESDLRPQRLDGIQLLSSAEVIDEEMVPLFEELYSSETDTYVREAIVKGLDRPDRFRDNAAVVEFLTTVVHYETDNTVRGGALLASVRISDDADFAISQSLDAVRSDAGDYQDYGVRALSDFVDIHTINGNKISTQHQLEIEQLMSEIMTDEFNDMPMQARTELDNLYSRFF